MHGAICYDAAERDFFHFEESPGYVGKVVPRRVEWPLESSLFCFLFLQ